MHTRCVRCAARKMSSAPLWYLAGALLAAALIVWLHYAAVLDFGCETWQHETCGIFFRCARCVHVLQNLYWLARARLYSSPCWAVLVVVPAAVILVASSCAQRTQRVDPSAAAAQCGQRASKSPSTVPRWILVQLHASSSAKLLVLVFSGFLLLAVCNQPTLKPRLRRGPTREQPSLVVFSQNWHGDEWGRWRRLLALAGIQLTDNLADRDSAHVTIDNDNCNFAPKSCCSAHARTPKVWAFSMYNGLPQQQAMHGPFEDFFPHVFSDCKYWFTKGEREAEVLRRAGLQVLAVPYFYNDITPAEAAWNRSTQIEINGFFNGMGTRSPQDFVQAFRIKREVPHVHFHGADALDPEASAAAEFTKSKFTLHIKHQTHGPPYWCNSVARSVASGVPVVMDRESWRRGLFESLVVHNVSGVVLDSMQDIIAYLQRVPDDEYIRLRNSTLHHGRFLRESPPPEKVQETRDFFWKVYSDTSWVFEGKPLMA